MHCAMNQKPFLDISTNVTLTTHVHTRTDTSAWRIDAIIDLNAYRPPSWSPSSYIYGVQMHVNRFNYDLGCGCGVLR